MAVGDAYVFPGFLTPVLTQLFFPKPPTTFLTCFCRRERQKYAGKKSRLNRGSNSQPPGHESDTFNTEPPGRGALKLNCNIKLTSSNGNRSLSSSFNTFHFSISGGINMLTYSYNNKKMFHEQTLKSVTSRN